MDSLSREYFSKSTKWLIAYPSEEAILAQRIGSAWLVAQTINNCLKSDCQYDEITDHIKLKIMGRRPLPGALDFLLSTKELRDKHGHQMYSWQSRIADTGLVISSLINIYHSPFLFESMSTREKDNLVKTIEGGLRWLLFQIDNGCTDMAPDSDLDKVQIEVIETLTKIKKEDCPEWMNLIIEYEKIAGIHPLFKSLGLMTALFGKTVTQDLTYYKFASHSATIRALSDVINSQEAVLDQKILHKLIELLSGGLFVLEEKILEAKIRHPQSSNEMTAYIMGVETLSRYSGKYPGLYRKVDKSVFHTFFEKLLNKSEYFEDGSIYQDIRSTVYLCECLSCAYEAKI